MFSRSFALLRSKSGRLGCMLAAAAALAGCGGSVVDEFKPERIISLGDEYSYIDATTGRKYTVNQLNADGSVNCDANRIWNQQLVESYGFSFSQCNPGNRDTSRALLYAKEDARVLDGAGSIVAQIQEHRTSGGGFRKGDLLIVMAGANDIHAIASGAGTEADKLQAARERGRALADRLNALLDEDVRLVVLSVPDQGTTPEAGAQAALLSQLTTRFNEELDLALVNDGRRVGWVSAQGEINQLQFNESQLYNVTKRSATEVACPAANPEGTGCDTATAASDYGNYLYAYGRHLSTVPHTRLFQLAETRARDNPF